MSLEPNILVVSCFLFHKDNGMRNGYFLFSFCFQLHSPFTYLSDGSTDKIYVAFFRSLHAQTYRSALAMQKMVVYGMKREP